MTGILDKNKFADSMETNDFHDFEAVLKEKFPDVTGEKIERFRAMGPLYSDWNGKINVISRKDIDSLYMHHVLHSLAIAGYFRTNMPEEYERMSAEGSGDRTFLDLGTGGGFPGIPLAIMFPGAKFTLCDSIGKKITVASGVASSLGLENVCTVNARAESLHERYDYVVSRAVTSLDKFMPWVRGKYNKGVIYLKGGDVSQEIAEAMGKTGLKKGSVHPWSIESWIRDPYFKEKLAIFIEA